MSFRHIFLFILYPRSSLININKKTDLFLFFFKLSTNDDSVVPLFNSFVHVLRTTDDKMTKNIHALHTNALDSVLFLIYALCRCCLYLSFSVDDFSLSWLSGCWTIAFDTFSFEHHLKFVTEVHTRRLFDLL